MSNGACFLAPRLPQSQSWRLSLIAYDTGVVLTNKNQVSFMPTTRRSQDDTRACCVDACSRYVQGRIICMYNTIG